MFKSLTAALHGLRMARPLGHYGVVPQLLTYQPPWPLKLVLHGLQLTAPAKKDLPEEPEERLVLAMQAMGPSVIKLGQVLSTRADVTGERVAAALTRLQDRLQPFPVEQARAIIERELEKPLSELFAAFDDTPVAAASIAQVHRATTLDGQDVAVKIVRPDIEQNIARDVELFATLARWVEKRPQWQRLKPVEVVATLRETISAETDLRLEAAAASEFAENFRGDTTVKVPAIDWARTSKSVLTMQWLQGTRISDVEALLAQGHRPDDLLQKASASFFRQVLEFGFFHADLHPGNVLVADDGALILIDFGIMGRLDLELRFFLARMLRGFLERDYQTVSDIHFDIGFVPQDASKGLFTQACRAIGEPILGKPLHDISLARLLGQLFAVTEQFNMPTQPQMLLLQKSMLVSEGIGRMLNDRINMWELARPMIADWSAAQQKPAARARYARQRLMQYTAHAPVLLAKLEAALDTVNAPRPRQRFARTFAFGALLGGGVVMLAVASVLLLSAL